MIDEERENVQEEINPRQVVYTQPTLFRRVMANLLDFLILILLTFAFLFAARAIVNVTPGHLAQLNIVNQTRLDSCLYVEYNGRQVTTIQYLENSPSITTEKQKMDYARDSIEGSGETLGFLNFCNASHYGSLELYERVAKQYDDHRLKEEYKYLDEPYFVKNSENKVIVNTKCLADNSSYYKVYKAFMQGYCESVLATSFSTYRAALRSLSIDLFAIEIPVSYALAGIIVYLIPTFIFRRGHKTLGKLAYKIGVVDNQCLNISNGKNVARFTIFYFAILLLSLVTFAVPVIISFTMMVFTKKHQSFQDYMLGLYEVETSTFKIYYDLEEAEIDQLGTNKKAIDFKRIEKE